ncbi:class I SAM-dependent DNA methyltransferase [Lentibacter sp. XHP0401]|uniref:class I SAM-dependent DNA methyltransferase n=1 Tax=Lentibacter sp. XHP0401 TaxID=2984334 RepID=UPI0021E86262|nr:class I SAM-dependent methyltransferase [Lentibacter sp. XHP0401]MCV2894220.1 class I SAM-dependent methyltransferase [Lentibacter sp. XHP0401]
MSDEEPDLDAAYGLKTPDDSKRLYAAWAKTYDAGFAARMDYCLPERVVKAFVGCCPQGPVLDIGAGTGLVGAHMAAAGLGPVDGVDICQEMLDVAAERGVYRLLFLGDMTGRLDVVDGAYGAVISSGTFTTGHVGPEALDEVLRVAATGAQIAISVSKAHWNAAGFAAKFAELAGQIADLKLKTVRIYGDKTEGAHALDEGYVVLFRKG